MDHELYCGIVIWIVQVFIPARSSANWNTRGESVGLMLVFPAGVVLVIVGACGALNEN